MPKNYKQMMDEIINKMDEAKAMGGKFIVRFKRGDQKPVQAIFDTKAQADAYEKEKRITKEFNEKNGYQRSN